MEDCNPHSVEWYYAYCSGGEEYMSIPDTISKICPNYNNKKKLDVFCAELDKKYSVCGECKCCRRVFLKAFQKPILYSFNDKNEPEVFTDFIQEENG